VTRQVRQFVAFVASPGDLPEERAALRRAAQSVNDTIGRRFGLSIVVEGWEQVQPAVGRPQAVINPRVDDCDIFIGVLNRRWGTPTGAYSSGFEEEYERALGRIGEDQPDIALFFRELSAGEKADPGAQLQQVLAFQERVREERVALYKTFRTADELELQLVLYLGDYVTRQAAAAQQPPAVAESPARATGGETPSTVSDATQTDSSADVDDARRQVGDALQSWADIVLGKPSAGPVDRDRLLSFAIALGQDDDSLGHHLVNRLYQRRESVHMSVAEADSWLRAFCEEAGRVPDTAWGRFVPGWFFFARDSDLPARLLAVTEEDVWQRARGAVLLLETLGARPAALWPADTPTAEAGAVVTADDAAKVSAVALWGAILERTSTASATLQYLHKVATPVDCTLLEDIVAAGAGHSWQTAARAVIASVFGDKRPAVDYLIAHPFSPAPWVITDVLQAVPDATTDNLLALLEGRHTSDPVRIAVFDELLGRDALDDTSGPAAVTVMLRRSDATRAHLLDRPHDAVPQPVRAWLRPGFDAVKREDRDLGLEERVDALTRTPDELATAATNSLTGLDAWQALSLQGAPSMAARAREVLRSGGQAFAEELDEANPRMTSIRRFVAGQARAAALRILTSVPQTDRQPDDIGLVLNELADGDYVTQQAGLQALVALAGSDELPALLDALPQALRRHDTAPVVAKILELGGTQAARTLLNDEDGNLAAAGTRALVTGSEVGEHELVDLLYHENSSVRHAAFDALVARLDEATLKTLLEEYSQRAGTYYYEVVAALDWYLYAPNVAVTALVPGGRPNQPEQAHTTPDLP
jgi:hypothetical protein